MFLCSFLSRLKDISQGDGTISLTHLDPHMMHKVFDTDWISASFQQSGNVLKIPSTCRILKMRKQMQNDIKVKFMLFCKDKFDF